MFTAWPAYNTHIPASEIHTKLTVFHLSTRTRTNTQQNSYKYETFRNCS